MDIKTNLPQVMALKSAVEKVAGFKLKGTKDFTSMVDFIEMETRAHISETTLQRLWGYSTRGQRCRVGAHSGCAFEGCWEC